MLQVKLLHFLQERTIERVGGAETITIDARIIAATNQNLEQAVKAGRFRDDLYYRLNVIELRMPSLRERPAEIVPLAEAFIAQTAETHRKAAIPLASEAARALIAYRWPGNVRELRNVIERAVVLCRGEAITVGDLPDRILAGPAAAIADRGLPLEELERRHIELVMQEAMTLEEAADMLGIDVTTLWRKRRKYGLE